MSRWNWIHWPDLTSEFSLDKKMTIKLDHLCKIINSEKEKKYDLKAHITHHSLVFPVFSIFVIAVVLLKLWKVKGPKAELPVAADVSMLMGDCRVPLQNGAAMVGHVVSSVKRSKIVWRMKRSRGLRCHLDNKGESTHCRLDHGNTRLEEKKRMYLLTYSGDGEYLPKEELKKKKKINDEEKKRFKYPPIASSAQWALGARMHTAASAATSHFI